MDYRNLFGIAAIILSAAVFVHSLKSANAFPQGANVNLGSNPVVSVGGSSSQVLFTAPIDQVIIISDLIVTATGSSSSGYACNSIINIEDGSGGIVGSVRVTSDTAGSNIITPTSVNHSFNGGLPIPASETASIDVQGNCTVAYTVSGYYAHP